jgi:hypothetical protein
MKRGLLDNLLRWYLAKINRVYIGTPLSSKSLRILAFDNTPLVLEIYGEELVNVNLLMVAEGLAVVKHY